MMLLLLPVILMPLSLKPPTTNPLIELPDEPARRSKPVEPTGAEAPLIMINGFPAYPG